MVKQEHYPDLIIENNEPDIIVVWQHGRDESQVMHIERERVEEFINQLTEANKCKQKK